MEQLAGCLTPRTIRRRRLLRAKDAANPELESLYHDEPTTVSPPVTSPYPQHSPVVVLGTPTHQLSRATPRRIHDITNIRGSSIFGPSLPLNERLNMASGQDSNNDRSSNSLDLSGYQIMPSKMDAAFSAAAAEPLFSRQNFFEDPPQHVATVTDDPDNAHGDIPPPSPQIPASPASSVTSIATTVSESVNLALLSWPGSPSPNNAQRGHNTGLTFGRVGSSFPSTPSLAFSPPPPPPTVFSPAYLPPISSPLSFAESSLKPDSSSFTRSPSPHTSPCTPSHQKPSCVERRVASQRRRFTKSATGRPRLPRRWAVTTISRPIRISPWMESTIVPMD